MLCILQIIRMLLTVLTIFSETSIGLFKSIQITNKNTHIRKIFNTLFTCVNWDNMVKGWYYKSFNRKKQVLQPTEVQNANLVRRVTEKRTSLYNRFNIVCINIYISRKWFKFFYPNLMSIFCFPPFISAFC